MGRLRASAYELERRDDSGGHLRAGRGEERACGSRKKWGGRRSMGRPVSRQVARWAKPPECRWEAQHTSRAVPPDKKLDHARPDEGASGKKPSGPAAQLLRSTLITLHSTHFPVLCCLPL